MGSLELSTLSRVVFPVKAIIMQTTSPLLGAPTYSSFSKATLTVLSPRAFCTISELLKTATVRPSGLGSSGNVVGGDEASGSGHVLPSVVGLPGMYLLNLRAISRV